MLIYYQQVLDRAHSEVSRLCAEIEHVEPMARRVKTLNTTLEKLHRQPDLHSLGQIRDLAELRVVAFGTWLPSCPSRDQAEGILIEVQVRTILQHGWAELIHVVLVYRREAGELLVQESFADGDVAMRRRFEPERVPEYADTEIVVLSADSVDTLRETHGRYFFSAAELARRLRDAVPAA